MGLTDVFRELAAGREAGIYERYAVGGAVAAAVYLEPTNTADVDIFIAFAPQKGSAILTLEPVYAFFKARGATVQGESLQMGGWPVQFLPPPTPLVDDALAHAVVHDIDGQLVPTFSPEHLAAVALETNRLKDKVRLQEFLAWDGFDRTRFEALVQQFGLADRWLQTQQLLGENP